MIITVVLKDPDGIGYTLDNEIDNEELRTNIQEKFFEYSEYCTLEINTKTMQAKVIPNY